MKTIVFFIAVIFLTACQEEPAETSPETSTGIANASADTVIYFRHEPEVDFFVLPNCDGVFECAVVDCIDIDCEAGKLFPSSCSSVPYTLKCNHDNAVREIVVLISGIKYPDYTACRNNKDVLVPEYNLQKKIPDGSKIDTPPQGIPTVRSQGLVIDIHTGVIDIDASVANGIFGPSPTKGTQHSFRVYYRLNDQSCFALNYTDITFIYEGEGAAQRLKGPTGGTVIDVKSC